jgi:hypothetical protein
LQPFQLFAMLISNNVPFLFAYPRIKETQRPGKTNGKLLASSLLAIIFPHKAS